jgi:glycine dehydrogenase
LIDVSEFKHINEVDISKRLIDYNFHPPTMSWPKKSTLMIEPTESESQEELNRFINALISIRREIDECPELLKNAPHPIKLITQPWQFPYSMERAFFPQKELKNEKHWPVTSRVNDLYGDKLIYESTRKLRVQ